MPALMEALRAALDTEDYEEQEHVIEALAHVGAAAVPPLLEIAAARNESLEYVVRQILGQMTADALRPFLPELIQLIPTTGRFIADAFRQLGPLAAPAVPALLDADEKRLIHNDTFALALSAIGSAAAPAVPRLVQMLFHEAEDPDEFFNIGRALAATGDDCVNTILSASRAAYQARLNQGAYVLTLFGPSAVPHLIEALQDEHINVRSMAALGLAKLAPSVAVPHLVSALSIADDFLQRYSAEALGGIGPAAVTAAPALRSLLASPEPRVVHAAAEALAAIWGDADVDELTRRLDDPHPAIRLRALQALVPLAGRTPPGRALVLRALRDPALEVRRCAAWDIQSILNPGEEDAVEPLRAALTDPEEQVRWGAATSLGRLRAAARPAIPELIALMHDPFPNVRRAAANTLDGMHVETPEMLGALIAALDDEDESVRHAAAEGLANWTNLFPEHAAAVLRRASDPDPVIRRGAVRLMGRAKEATPELVAFLRTTLRESDSDDIRDGAAAGLGRLKVDTPEVIAELFAYLDASGTEAAAEALASLGDVTLPGLEERLLSRPELRPAIATALDRRDKHNLGAVPILGLMACLSDERDEVRRRAVDVLAWVKPLPADVVAALRTAAIRSDPLACGTAVFALRNAASDKQLILSYLIEAFADPDASMRHNAMMALDGLDIPLADKLPLAGAALRDAAENVRSTAAQVIAKAGPAAGPLIQDLIGLLGDANHTARAQAAAALGAIGPAAAAAVPALERLLGDPEHWPRSSAAGALGNIGAAAAGAVPVIARLVREDPDASVRAVAAEALQTLGATETAADAVDDLRRLLHDPDGEVRGHAASALGALGSVAAVAVPELLAALADPAWGDVREAIEKQHTILGQWRILSDAMLAALAYDRRIHVARALGILGPAPGVIDGLRAAAADTGEMLRTAVFSALHDLRPASDTALQELCAHPDADVRARAEAMLREAPADGMT